MTATDGYSVGHELSEIDTEAYLGSDADFFDTGDVKQSARHGGSSRTNNAGTLAKHTDYTSQSPPPYRSNRWKGSDEKWRRLTRPERDLIGQLDELENRDWAKGLYRAYLIKKRRRRLLEDDRELRTRNAQADWTAWPLYPEDIAQADDRIEYKFRKQRETSTTPRRSRKHPAKVAHIDLHGQKYNAAPEDSPSDGSGDDSDSDPPSIADLTEAIPSDNPHIFKAEPDPRPSSSLEETVIAQMMKTGKERFLERTSKPGFQSAGYTPSADDELMTAQLRPIARNVITQFDDLLLGMHQGADKGRGGGRHMRVDSESSYSDYTSVRKSPVNPSKGSRVDANAIDPTRSDTRNSDPDTDTNAESVSHLRGRSSKRRGSTSTKGKGKASSFRSQDRYVTHTPSRKRMGNRTWESVMLVASLQDWPEEVIDKTNQRLKEIFGKSATLAPRRRDMRLDHWDESLVCSVLECPRHREPFSEESDLDRHMRLIHGGRTSPRPFSLPASRSQSRSRSRARDTLSGAEETQADSREWRRGMKGDYVNTNLICPVAGCRRHKEPFSRLWNLKEHMRLRHPMVDLPESIRPQSKKNSQSQRRPHSRPRSALSWKYKSEDVVVTTDEERESGREDTRDKGMLFSCPIKSCKRSKDGFSRNWNLQKHIRLMHPAWRAEDVG
ncbi:hypothetical protein PISL3812_08169 [Talaromyces islandicus]|uniref:C2H2-type domain-containing protein n=1 Tax=Talaromyces islandicus TaxID=28573 RepID=A0A0U1M7T0_TALIS|nr:hypothetical protein PISL3812_08169 [Talaromyces islandicus]